MNFLYLTSIEFCILFNPKSICLQFLSKCNWIIKITEGIVQRKKRSAITWINSVMSVYIKKNSEDERLLKYSLMSFITFPGNDRHNSAEFLQEIFTIN